jgi:MoaA/NifB/PqqE/SkfB family radical SAM enzyme
MRRGIFRAAKKAGRFYLTRPEGRAFMQNILPALERAAERRAAREAEGLHVPPMLIASITSRCNLRCAGCYARQNGGCGDARGEGLPAEAWRKIFREAAELGVSFVLLAGGEPLARRDVLDTAKDFPELIFPVFTNGTLMDADALALFDKHRNLLPVLSLEGGPAATDARRGGGVYASVREAMRALNERRALFGASVTVTSQNIGEVSSAPFARELRDDGLGLLFFVEYVPTGEDDERLALTPTQQIRLRGAVKALGRRFPDLIAIEFPGNEEAMGGCLASGRGFFHINSGGGAEPCPFSPHARLNLTESSMREVLASDYFAQLQSLAQSAGPHIGGCVLHGLDEQVSALAAR